MKNKKKEIEQQDKHNWTQKVAKIVWCSRPKSSIGKVLGDQGFSCCFMIQRGLCVKHTDPFSVDGERDRKAFSHFTLVSVDIVRGIFRNAERLLPGVQDTGEVCLSVLSVGRSSWSAKDEYWAPDTCSYILIHHTGFVVNQQLEIWAPTMTKQSPPALSDFCGALSNTYKIFSFPNHHLSVGLSLLLFGILLLLMLVAIFSSPVFYPHSKIHYQSKWKVEGGGEGRGWSSITVSVGGYLGEWHVHSWKNDPTSNSSMNQRGITNTTHSKAIKQVQGGVLCVCVCLARIERKVARKILTINRTERNRLFSWFSEWIRALSRIKN